MSGSHLSLIVMPIVIAIALAGWIGAVLWAERHPHYKHQRSAPRTEVAGGAFRALEGGRQLMPIPGDRPAPEAAMAAGAEGAPEVGEVKVPAARAPAGRASTASATATVPNQADVRNRPAEQDSPRLSGSQLR